MLIETWSARRVSCRSVSDSPEIDVWDPWPGESAKAYQAFRVYRDLPSKERSIKAAYKQEMGRKIPSGRRTRRR
jgi:hypothetical protein